MSGWTQNLALPGSVRPVYGARYPVPPESAQSTSTSQKPTKLEESVPSVPSMTGKTQQRFKQYEHSVSDVWDTDVTVNNALAHESANHVLAQHANSFKNDTPPSHTSIYPKLNDDSPPSYPWSNSTPIKAQKPMHTQKGDEGRFGRLRRVVKVSGHCDPSNVPQNHMIDIEQLRKDCWLGIPNNIRPMAWRILSGYVPVNYDRQQTTLDRKRNEYWNYVEQYFHTRYDEQQQDTFRQIHIDIPRMCPLVPLFQQKLVQEIFERILYIWAIRHPASGYVQGINDLVTPFFVVFLSEFISDGAEVGTYDVAQIQRKTLEAIEADSFWCFTALLDTIQDNYTFAQPGIQRKVAELKYLVGRVDGELTKHLERHQVEFLQFAFRWMNNLLMREIPLRATIRLWDTYLSERNGFSQFHTYVCVAFLRLWSRQIQKERDFQGAMILLQNLPTQNWSDQQICELTADAYSLMQVFHGAKREIPVHSGTF
ncbi:unnamed protein product [Bursaphelenchus okinawaensis]|uniref:Rab-GAP TBC domain-containing protein n=1 Tax=Bursaphelenchus okinawaensis TaxID=465554 RepID=A0A811KXN8_9BILA|nr:unnamed protein product [Bursaphelenchus okinawaensis]CAG9113931.1 unnamed protein product [Bursaphelenchus okinawaensis]